MEVPFPFPPVLSWSWIACVVCSLSDLAINRLGRREGEKCHCCDGWGECRLCLSETELRVEDEHQRLDALCVMLTQTQSTWKYQICLSLHFTCLCGGTDISRFQSKVLLRRFTAIASTNLLFWKPEAQICILNLIPAHEMKWDGFLLWVGHKLT